MHCTSVFSTIMRIFRDCLSQCLATKLIKLLPKLIKLNYYQVSVFAFVLRDSNPYSANKPICTALSDRLRAASGHYLSKSLNEHHPSF